ncbi:alpha/beta-hydrolase [Epithele typhae]|uniref:alpha/beta-hydrolase n=1 Tax=Epithele typhae TaxID=378194 RepID=UPI0020083FEC|nr:alpha/beta-hydrolase [Epithele typhae]KAH9916739.1 alpha/beta-hydrolase [Epithele typhae]
MSGFLPSIESFAKGATATAAGIGTVGVGLLFFGQNYLIYPSAFPPGSRTEVPVPTDFDLPYEDLILTTPDNVKLRCYLLTQRKELPNHGVQPLEVEDDESNEEVRIYSFSAKRPTVIMFHGNGGNVGHRIPLAKVFYVRMRCNVLMLSYRGYGLSEGNPSEKGIRIDAQCALDHILHHPQLSRTPIFLYGQSIGGAVAIDLATRNKHIMRGLILENTFLSLPQLVPSAMPVLGPFAFLCHQKWDSASKVPLIPAETPMLLLSGTRDEVVPPEHMKGLWELVQLRIPGGYREGQFVPPVPPPPTEGADAAKDESAKTQGKSDGYSRFVEFDWGSHNDTCTQPGYWTSVSSFVKTVVKAPPPPPTKD